MVRRRGTGWQEGVSRAGLAALAMGVLLMVPVQAQTLPQDIQLTVSSGSIHVGETLVLTAQNNYSPYSTSLEMRFFEDTPLIPGCTAVPLDALTNSASCTVTASMDGTFTYSASLGTPTGGVGNDLAVSNAVSVTVDKWDSQTFLSMNVGSPAPGQVVEFTAEIWGHFPGGDVLFYELTGPDPNQPLCAVTVSAGGSAQTVASCLAAFIVPGVHQLIAHYQGDAANHENWSDPLSFSIATPAGATEVALDASPSVPVAGEPVMIGVRVSGDAPGGSVTIRDDNSVVCTATLDSTATNVKQVSCPWTFATPGSHLLQADYSGNTGNLPSHASRTVQVEPAPSVPVRVELRVIPADVLAGQSAALRAEVQGGSEGGAVTFLDGGVPMQGCSEVPVVVLAAGLAAADCPFTLGVAGAHEFAATYVRGGLTRGGGVEIRVPGRSTSTELAVVSGEAWVGRPVLLQATVAGDALRAGTVRFLADGQAVSNCEAVALTPLAPLRRMADCVLRFPSPGTHALRAEYTGDGQSGASFDVISLRVGNPAPALTLSAFNPAFVDQPVVIRATVDAGLPGGTVGFLRDGALIPGCTSVVPLDPSGGDPVAECSVVFEQAGRHRIDARYDFTSGRESAALDVDVQSFPTATRLQVQAPVAGLREGGIASLEAIVEPVSVAGARVTFTDAGVGIGSCMDVALVVETDGLAVARCDVALHGSGMHFLGAAFPGDRAHSPSSDETEVAVAADSDALSLSLPDGAVVGQLARLRAAASAATVLGTVAFSDEGVAIAGCHAQPLTGGQGSVPTAECRVRFPRAGLRLVTAERDAGNVLEQAALTIPVGKATSSLGLSAVQVQGSADWLLEAEIHGYFPDGAVEFVLEGTVITGCESVLLDSQSNQHARAACTLPAGGALPRWVAARYAGNDNNEASDAVLALSGTVSASLALSREDAAPARVGRDQVLQARVSGAAPTGRVRFLDGAKVLSGCEAVALVPTGMEGVARCHTRFAQSGTHALRAEYAGDAVHAPAMGELSVPVEKNPSVTALEIERAVAYAGGITRLRARVAGYRPGGSVAFFEDQDPISGCATVPLQRQSPEADAGQAECEVAFVQAGNRLLRARYGGDLANALSEATLAHFLVLRPPVLADPARISFFGQEALRFTLHNPEASAALRVVVSFEAAQVGRIAFLPACSTQSGGDGGAVRCEDPVALGISCRQDADVRACEVATLEPGASFRFVVFPEDGWGGGPRAVISVDGTVVGQTVLNPGN